MNAKPLMIAAVLTSAWLELIVPTIVAAGTDNRPNIVWIVVDDMSSHFGYQGEKLVDTPHVDRLAREGVAFSRAYATAPVCSTFRSALITGMYQTTIGAHHHRSSRGKQFLYEEGILIPFVAWGPGILPEGKVRDELVAHIDLAATSLQLAGVQVPDTMQGRPLFDPDAKPRDYVVSACDRCGETVDRIRSIRMGNFKYIRNYHPLRPYLQPCDYKDRKPFMAVLRELDAAGQLNEAQSLHMAQTRPKEELYDLGKDPWEVNNLVNAPAHGKTLEELRAVLANWELETDDKGRFPESMSMYESDMAAYLQQVGRRNPEKIAPIQANIELMKKWRADGK